MFPFADSSYRLQPVLPFAVLQLRVAVPVALYGVIYRPVIFPRIFHNLPRLPSRFLPALCHWIFPELCRAAERCVFYCPYALSILCSHMDTVVKTCRINCQFHTHFPPVSNQNTSPCVTAAPPSVSARSAPVSVRRSLKRCCIFSCSAASVSFACADTSSDTAEIVCTESAISSICRLKL